MLSNETRRSPAYIFMNDPRSNGGLEEFAVQMAVTPELAQYWLDNFNNRNYRKLKPHRSGFYAQEMREGRWSIVTTAIGFQRDGELVNGQNRLKALILSKTTQRFWIIFGMNNEAAANPAEDTGQKRDVREHLSKIGYKHSNLVAAMARTLWRIRLGGGEQWSLGMGLSETSIIEIVDNNPSIQDVAILGLPARATMNGSTYCAWLWLAMWENPKLAYQCHRIFCDLEEAFTSHPFVKLRETMIKSRAENKTKGSMREWLLMQYLFSAWDKAKNDMAIKRLLPIRKIVICDKADEALQSLTSSRPDTHPVLSVRIEAQPAVVVDLSTLAEPDDQPFVVVAQSR